jgi:pimeloyl-ACP methyl ester carboxylesterase
VPTLVLHRRNDRAVRIGAGRDMASHINGAQFVELDGDDHWFFAGAQQPLLEAIKGFVRKHRLLAASRPNSPSRRTRA